MRTLAALIGALLACRSPTSASERPSVAWEAPIEIASGGGERGPWRQNDSRYDHVDDPSVVIDARGTTVVAWVDHRHKDVFVQRFAPGEARARARAVHVSRTPAVFSWLPRLAVSPPHPHDVYVLWQEIVFSGGSHGGEVLFARSVDGGRSFGSPHNLSSSIGGDGKGRIDRDTWHNGSLDVAVAPDGTVFAAWTEYAGQLWFTRSGDRGASFAAPVQVSGTPAAPARAPALATSGDTVYLAWALGEDAGADLRLAVSRDRGASFAAPMIVAPSPGYSDAPKLAVDAQGTVHLAYAESEGGPFAPRAVCYARSHDRGRRFERARVLSRPAPGAESAAFPALALGDRGQVHVLWERYPQHGAPPRGLALASSLDGGATFSAPTEVPGSVDPGGGGNGSFQGRLMRKLAVRGDALAIVNSSLAPGRSSRVWLMRGTIDGARARGMLTGCGARP